MSSPLEDQLTAFAARIIRGGAADIRRQYVEVRAATVLVSDPLARAYAEGMVAGVDVAADVLDRWADNIIASILLADLDGNDA
ncbi:hypothetical protein GCM10009592_26710 [Brachybacterium rhamnosum]|uniref:TetR family transcriptional regulator n=1 Tax=Brachybacterium rhamnosum TaxID=173361 RepID=A0ABW4PZU1_9MICO